MGGSYSARAEAIYKLFEDKISKNKIITVATKSETFKHPIPKRDGRGRTLWVDKQGNQKDYPGLFDDHIYAIVEKVETGPGILIDPKTMAKTKGGTFKYICIRNPHAEEGFEEYDITKGGKIKRIEIKNNGGKLRMELNDFLKYFESYDVSD